MLGPLKLLVTAACALLLAGCGRKDVDRVTVFSAAGMTDAMTEIVASFDGRADLSLAASSTLARQIERGAPAHVYVSASGEWMDYLEDRDLLVPRTRVRVAGGRLVLVAPASSGVTLRVSGEMDLAGALGGGRLATGDPDHVPVGRYARSALETLGLWEEVEPRLARSSTTRAALALVERGEAELGIVYRTDALASSKVRIVDTFPRDSHPPIVFWAAVVQGRDTPQARRFVDHLVSSQANEILSRLGYEVR
jgi:molybdate transport system substrate-binding protein